MYKEIKFCSLLFRMYLFSITVGSISIFANPVKEYVFGEIVSLWIIIAILSYAINGRYIYKDRSLGSGFGALSYCFVYSGLTIVLWIGLSIATFINILPL